jgi:hypothetical protein
MPIALEAETAITLCDPNEQGYIRQSIARKLKHIAQSNNSSRYKNQMHKYERTVANTIKGKNR